MPDTDSPAAERRALLLRSAGWAGFGLLLALGAVLGAGWLGWFLGWLWWPGALLVAGAAGVAAYTVMTAARPLRILGAVVVVAGLLFGALLLVHPEPLRAPGWEVEGRVVAAADGTVVVQVDEYVEGRRSDDGERRWRVESEGLVRAVTAGVVVVAQPVDEAPGEGPGERSRLLAVDLESGDELWTRDLALGRPDLAPVVTVHDGVAVINDGDGQGLGIDVRTGETRWKAAPGTGALSVVLPVARELAPDLPWVVQAPASPLSRQRVNVLDATTGELVTRTPAGEKWVVTPTHAIGELADGSWRGVPLDGGDSWTLEGEERPYENPPSQWLPGAPPRIADLGEQESTVIDLSTGQVTDRPAPSGWKRVAPVRDVSGWFLIYRHDDLALWRATDGKQVSLGQGEGDAHLYGSGDGAAAVSTRARSLIGQEYKRVSLVSADGEVAAYRFEKVVEVRRIDGAWVVTVDGGTRVVPD